VLFFSTINPHLLSCPTSPLSESERLYKVEVYNFGTGFVYENTRFAILRSLRVLKRRGFHLNIIFVTLTAPGPGPVIRKKI